MSQLFKNAARAALAAPIAAADTSLTVDITKADLFPAANTGTDPVNTTGKDWYKVVLEDVNHNIEIAYVRTRTLGSAVMSNVLRGQEGTTALSFATGSIVGLRLTALDLQEAIDLAAQATTPGQDVLWAATVDAQVQALGTGLQKQIATAFTTTGTSTAYLLTPTPAITAYVANLSYDVTFDKVCGDNPTLQISGVAIPPNLVKQLINGSYANIKAGDIPANHRSRVTLISPTQAIVEKLPPKAGGAGADIASAATLDLTAATGQVVRVTGTVATDTITMNQGVMFCIAAAAWPLTYHATTNPVQGGASYTCEAGDVVVYMKDGSDVLHNWILPKDGQPIEVVAQANGGTGYGVATRQLAQIQESWSAAVAAGSTVIPWDDSIPQSSEGDQYFSVAITPANASSRLEIDVLLNVGHSGTAQITGALFLDSEANARAAGNVANVDGSYQPHQLSIKYSMTAGSTSAMTFKVRAGGNVAGTLNLNGSSNVRRLGGVLYSGITVREYLP